MPHLNSTTNSVDYPVFLTFSAGEGGGDVLKPRAKGTCDAKTLENSHVEPKN